MLFLSVYASDLMQFNHLTTLEIRGTGSHQNLNFLMDEPLPMIKHVNFESIELIGDEQMKKKMSLSQHPSETYDYVPESERVTYNVSLELKEEVQIVSYEVYRMEMQKSKEPTFYGWTHLNVLRIHKCHLDEVHWEMFDGLQNLQHLSLEHNEIKIIPPFAFYGALHIRSLSLARNSILDMNYRALAGLLDLEKLDLSNNNLTKLSEMSFPPFPKLEKIDLRLNPIKFIFPMTFGVMNMTRNLVLGSELAMLDLSIGSSFTALEQLTTLILQNVSIPMLNQIVFRGLKNVRNLKMSGFIKRIEFDAFAEMPFLRELTLSNCQIIEISMDAFFGVRNLEIIDLSNNQIRFIPPGIFEEQKQLTEIYLQGNQLSILPRGFFNNPHVKLIRLIDNPWVCSCDMRSWRQAITNRVRSTRLSSSKSTCSVDPQTGFETCADAQTNQYSYQFDNKMSPRCDGGPKEFQYRSVYYTLRHNIECQQMGSDAPQVQQKQKLNYIYSGDVKSVHHQMDKMRVKHKYSMTMEKMNLMAKLLNEKQQNVKQNVKTSVVNHSNNVFQLEREHFNGGNGKTLRKQAYQQKIKNTLNAKRNGDIIKEQEITNNIAF